MKPPYSILLFAGLTAGCTVQAAASTLPSPGSSHADGQRQLSIMVAYSKYGSDR